MRLRRLAGFLFVLLAATAWSFASAQTAEPQRVRDVIYQHKVGVALTMDVFKPARPNGIGVIWMVSGGWVSNHNNLNPELAAAFTARGQTVFEVVHGSQPKFTLPEIVQDIHRAVRFIRTHAAEYGVDPDRLGICGGSAGGHLSLMMGAYGGPGSPQAADAVDRASSVVQAVACLFPPTDLLNYGKEGASAMEIVTLRPFWPAFGITSTTSAEERARLGRALSPIYGLTARTPPTLIIHGDADQLVPLQQSERLMARLAELKVPHRLEVRKDKAHGWAGMEQELPLMADWFERYLARPAP
ncbi:MAG: alpha/beta hydrolase [Chthonomonadales bacterium]|nr:alpha/beta hydrolase [Chthonomonadales bacterium]